jgi:YVTN family beta-propeller protein
MRSAGRRVLALSSLALAAAGCGEREYEPYAGEAYPNRRPPLVIPAGGAGFVTDSRSDTISVIDLESGDRIAHYPVGRDPVSIDGPHHVAVDPDGRAVFIALSYPVVAGTSGPHASHGSSLQPGYVQKLSMDDLRILGQVRIDSNPGEIVISQDHSRVVTSHFDLQRALQNTSDLEAARATLAVIDPDQIFPTGSPDPTFITVCVAPHGMALSRPSGAKAYVACYGEDVLAVVDLEDPDAEIERIPVGPEPTVFNPTYGPYAAVMSPDGSTLAVSLTTTNEVVFFDVATETFSSERIKTQGVPYFAAWSEDGSHLYVPTQSPDAIILYDLTEGAAEQLYRAFEPGECDAPHVAELNGDQAMFIACEGDQVNPGHVVMLDPETLETLETAEVGVYPDAFVRVPGGAK